MNAMSSDQAKLPRRYELKARAERQRATRERIVAATEQLHREVGPARTTIADIARRAGVERLTVYNNFPELGDLLAACQGRFLAAHPPPDLAPPASATGDEAVLALEVVLARLYGWYRDNRPMVGNVQRDRHLVPELEELLNLSSDPGFDAAADGFAALIATGRLARQTVRRLVRLALEFRTWQLLADDGASDREIASLLAGVVARTSG